MAMAEYSSRIPKWQSRFVDARNHLSEAAGLMEQAYFEDMHNEKFHALFKRMYALLKSVDAQAMRNLKRLRKEGWIKK
jgi:hypothetical protein